MANEIVGKHMVWTKNPTTGNRIGFGYSTLKEVEGQAVAGEQASLVIIDIVPTCLPIPNPPRED